MTAMVAQKMTMLRDRARRQMFELAAHLAACSRAFEGDLQRMLILALDGQSCLSSRCRSTGNEIDGAIVASAAVARARPDNARLCLHRVTPRS